jgi:2,3-diketo-5-methylthio-1-phosphopentane phosphatase
LKDNINISIFTDFDGTITYKDIGDELFRDFGELEPYHSWLDSGGITIDEYWKIAFSNLKQNLNKSQIADYALTFEVDPFFKDFANFCIENKIELSVISDGFEEYILPVLNNIGLNTLPVFCNKLIFNDSSLPSPFFRYASESCTWLCEYRKSASCKRNSMLVASPPENVIVYIGDGVTDYCAAQHSDIIFAKKILAALCNKNKIPHYPFNNFLDIIHTLRDIIEKNNYKIRRQAQLLRKKAFEIE